MENIERIAVVGAGIVGINCAVALQEQGYQVTVIDKEGIGAGCSRGNAGHFATEQVFPLADKSLLWQLPKMLLDPLGPVALSPRYFPKALPWFMKFIANMANSKRNKNKEALKQLNKHAIDYYRPLLAKANAKELLTTKGSLLVFETTDIKEVESHYNLYKNEGVAVELLNREQTLSLEPHLNKNVNYSLYFTDVGHTASPYQICVKLADYAKSIGVIFDTKLINSITTKDNNIAIGNNSSMQNFDKVVIATGAWSKPLLQGLGYKLPIETERGYSLDVAIENKDFQLSRPVASAERKFIITPMSHGLRFAGTVEFAGNDLPANMARANMLHKNAAYVLDEVPEFDEKNPNDDQQWMGFRPSMPDSLPVIGEAPNHKNLYFALGHQHLGLTLGAITGTLISQIISKQKTDISVSPFCISRFN